MQYAGQPAHQQLVEHNRAVRRRSDRLRATAAYPRGCMAAAEREPRETDYSSQPNDFAQLGFRASFLRLHCDRLRCWGAKNFVLEETAECETEGRAWCLDPPLQVPAKHLKGSRELVVRQSSSMTRAR
jgi:hypothetical protein